MKGEMLKLITNTYEGMPLNSSAVINNISLIIVCSFGGFFAGLGSGGTDFPGSAWDSLTLQRYKETRSSRVTCRL